jgi:hypothetical protein
VATGYLPRSSEVTPDALGRPEIVEYDPASDDLRVFASAEVRRQWVKRRAPRQRWVEQQEIHRMEENRDLFEGMGMP